MKAVKLVIAVIMTATGVLFCIHGAGTCLPGKNIMITRDTILVGLMLGAPWFIVGAGLVLGGVIFLTLSDIRKAVTHSFWLMVTAVGLSGLVVTLIWAYLSVQVPGGSIEGFLSNYGRLVAVLTCFFSACLFYGLLSLRKSFQPAKPITGQ